MRRPVLGGLLALLLATSACGGDEPSAEPSAAPSSASSTPSPSEDTASASPSESTDTSSGTGAQPGDTYADAEPATGLSLTEGPVTVHAPADWPDQAADGSTIVGPTPDYTVQLGTSTPSGPDVDALAQSAAEFSGFVDGGTREADAVVLGEPAYHVSGTDDVFANYIDQFGFVYENRAVEVRVGTPQDVDPAEREALVAAVMASVTPSGA